MTVPILRNSERKTFADCPQKWWWSWREGLVPRGSVNIAFWFGTGVHLALAKWYCGPKLRRGPDPVDTWYSYAAGELSFIKTIEADENNVARYEDALTLGATMLEGYVSEYGRDDHMEVIQPEQTFSLDVPWPKDRQGVYEHVDAILAQFRGTYDLVYRDLRHGWLMLEEHKTAGTVSTQHLPMDNQGGAYWATATGALRRAGLIGEKEWLRGIEYNFLRKALPDDRPRNRDGYATNKPLKADYVTALSGAGIVAIQGRSLEKLTLALLQEEAEREGLTVFGEVSKLQPKPLFERHLIHRTASERRSQLERVQDDAVIMQAHRDGLLPIRITPGLWTCRGCDFRAMCELKERGGDWEGFKALQFKPRDPYADHRKSTSE